MNYAEQFFNQLNEAQEVIKSANEGKAKVIDNFLGEITDITNVCYDLWDDKEVYINQALKDMEQKYSFKFPYDYNDELHKERITREICESLPVCNAAQENIIESLPGTNEQGYLGNQSTQEIINIDIQPYNQYSRYHPEPEDNQESFYYIMPTKLHEQLLQADFDGKKSLLEQYMNDKIDTYLKQVEEKVKVKADIVKKTIEKIDFNDPAIVAELRSKLKL